MVQNITDIERQELLRHSPAGQVPKVTGSSYYRGETCNFNPYLDDYGRLEFLDQFVLKGWRPASCPITRDTRITAFGSCFADEIAKHLAAIGFSLSRERNPNIYISAMGDGLVNVHALAQQFEWALENIPPPQGLWHGFRGREFGYDEEVRLRTREVMLDTEFFILTFGLSEVWYDEVTGGVFWSAVPLDKFDKDRHRFRVCSFAETKAQIARICELIRRHVPRAKVLMTLSPVPLQATFRPIGALTANAPSKAILRAALDEFLREHWKDVGDWLFYYPSYEIATELFFSRYLDDGQHLQQDIVKVIVTVFEAIFCDTQASYAAAAALLREVRLASARHALHQAELMAPEQSPPPEPGKSINVVFSVKTALWDLRQSGRQHSTRESATVFLGVARSYIDFLRLEHFDRWQRTDAACATADDVFALFAELIAATSALAVLRGLPAESWESEARLHGRYALARLSGVVAPASFGPVTPLAEAFQPGTASFDVMVREAVCNMTAILQRATLVLGKRALA